VSASPHHRPRPLPDFEPGQFGQNGIELNRSSIAFKALIIVDIVEFVDDIASFSFVFPWSIVSDNFLVESAIVLA
jgi:hypothetical protein